jgi:putative membrane protein
MGRMKFLIMIAAITIISCDEDDVRVYSMSSEKFMQQAANSGKYEVTTGSLAVEKASNTEVESFASMMVVDHTTANSELMILAESKGVALPDTFDTEKQAKYSTLTQLSGINFDKRYIDEMVAAHDADVIRFDSAAKFANDEDVRAWAAKQLPILQMHQQHAHHLDTLTNNL